MLPVPAFGIIGFHPYHEMVGCDEGQPCKHFIRSRLFEAHFDSFTETEGVKIFESYCRRNKGGPIGSSIAIVTDDNGEDHEFLFDSFSNTHETLTLATHLKKRALAVGF